MEASPRVLKLPQGRSAWDAVGNKFSLREPYLIDSRADEPNSNAELVKVLKTDKRAFYYYKQRRLFRRYHFEYSAKSPTCRYPSVSPLAKNLSPKPSNSPLASSLTPKSLRHLTPSFTRRKPLREEWTSTYRALANRCEIEGNRDLSKERNRVEAIELRKVCRESEWSREVLDKVIDCEPAVLEPFYESEKDALRSFHEDIQRFAQEHRQKARHTAREAAKFALLLRSHRNMLL